MHLIKRFSSFMLPALLVIVVAGLGYGWWQEAKTQQINSQERQGHLLINGLYQQMDTYIKGQLQAFGALGKPVNYSALAKIQQSLPGVLSLVWLDPQGTVQHIIGPHQNLPGLTTGSQLKPQEKAFLDNTTLSEDYVLGVLNVEPSFGTTVIVYDAVRHQNTVVGFVKVKLLLENVITDYVESLPSESDLILAIYQNNERVYQRGNPTSGLSYHEVRKPSPLTGSIWTLSAKLPSTMWLEPRYQFAISLLFAFLIGWLCWQWQRNKHKMRLAQDRFDSLTEILPDMVCEIDTKFRVKYANSLVLATFGYNQASLAHGIDYILLFAKNERFNVRKILAELSEKPALHKTTVDMQKAGGTSFPCEITLAPMHDRNKQFIGFKSVMRDVSTWKQAEQDVERLSHYDELTGLPNRALFKDRLVQDLSRAKRTEKNVALLVIDLDQFKLVNDSLGHAEGDIVLKAVAQRLSNYLREGDTLARIGSDEFALIVSDTSVEDVSAHGASVVARKVLSNLMKPFMIDSREVFLSGCIGLAMAPKDGDTPQALLRAADIALIEAKSRGKNNFQFASTDFNVFATQRTGLEKRLRYALKQNQFNILYQPIIAAQDAKMIGIEALLYWTDPKEGLQAPDSFLREAEENGLIVEIGGWAFEQVCHDIHLLQSKNINVRRAALNLSPKQLQEPQLLEMIEAALEQYQLAPEIFELEIQEHVLFNERFDPTEILNHFSKKGFRIALDDFGTDYSSISYLKGHPISAIKIDKSFIANIVDGKEDLKLVEAMLAFAKHLNLTVTAEGVETEQQFQLLKARGCDEVQGYYFAKPMAFDELVKYCQ